VVRLGQTRRQADRAADGRVQRHVVRRPAGVDAVVVEHQMGQQQRRVHRVHRVRAVPQQEADCFSMNENPIF